MRRNPFIVIVAFLLVAVSGVLGPVPGAGAGAVAPSYDWNRAYDAGGRWSAVATSSDGLITIAGYDLALSKVRITRDGGVTWAELAASPSASWNDFAMSDDGSVIVLAGSDSPRSDVWVSTDSGATFSHPLTASPMEYKRLAVSGDGSKILVLSDGGVLLSTDRGSTFGRIEALTGLTRGDVAVTSNGTTMFAAQYGGNVWRSTDTGSTWAVLESAAARLWTSFDVSADGTTMMGVASYDDRGVRVSNDSGATFTEPASVGATFAYQLAQGGMSRDGKVLIATSYGTEPMLSVDGGATWASSGGAARGWLRMALSADGGRIFGTVESQGVLRRALPPPPTVSGLNLPLPSFGGRTVEIRGTNFANVTSVKVGGVTQEYTVVSRTIIRVTPGPIATSTAEVAVTTASGSASTVVSVSFPEITSIFPSEGPTTGGTTGGGTTIDVSGNFSGVTVNSATIGGRAATVTPFDDVLIRLTVPPGVAGTADVVLETSVGRLSLPQAFTYYTLGTPNIDTLTPASTSWAGGATVTLAGSGLGDATAVTIGGRSAPILGRTGRNEVQVRVPTGRVGLNDVTVTNAAGTRAFARAFRYTWESLGSQARWAGVGGVSSNGVLLGPVYAIATLPNGDLIVGGGFNDAAGIPEADNIARWNGTTWSALGSNEGANGAINGTVHDIVVDTDGSIIAVGDFDLPDGKIGIARYANGTWSSVAGGLSNGARAVALAPDGTLYVGGYFENVGSQPTADFVVRLDRQNDTWVALGSNGAGNGALTGIVRSLAITSNGIIAGGHFANAAGLPTADYIARWNGTTWSALGSNGSGDGALPARYVTTAIDVETINGTEVVLAGTCRNGGGDGNAYLFTDGQWIKVNNVDLDDCVRDAMLLPDGRAVLAGWFTETIAEGAPSGLIVGSDSLGWETLGSGNLAVEVFHLDQVRGRMVVGTRSDEVGGDPTADYLATADSDYLGRDEITVANPGTITVTSAGGSTITLTGTGFGQATKVTVGDTPISSVTITSRTQLTFTAPAGLSGASRLSVYNNRNLVSFPDAIVVNDPVPPTTPTQPTTPTVTGSTPPQVDPPSQRQIAQAPLRNLAQVPTELDSGSNFTATFRGFNPGAWVYAYIASKPRLVGTARADSSGAATMKITVPRLAGRHSLVLYEPVAGILKRQAITITTRELPATGAGFNLMQVALCLMLLGSLLVAMTRRTRSR